jgi:hypothetical protein
MDTDMYPNSEGKTTVKAVADESAAKAKKKN